MSRPEHRPVRHAMHLVKAIAASLFIAINTVAVWIPLTWWILVLPFLSGERLGRHKEKMDKIIWWWTGNNRRMIAALGLTRPEITWHAEEELSPHHWYLVISNHQSWTDIVLLQSYLYGVIPPLKFFTKEQLIWVPGIGLAMKVLGFPYVKRVTKAQVKANPKLLTADRDNVMQACEGFKNHPTSILNFVEGTRRTEEKHSRQNSEYAYLLRPKIGGLDYVLEGMRDHLHRLVDVTIIYPDGVPTFWAFLQGKCPRVILEVQPLEIPAAVREAEAAERRAVLAQWIRDIWVEKDRRITGAVNGDAVCT